MFDAPRLLDTAGLIDTPEGVHLEVAPAGPVPRALAFGVDALIRLLALFVISISVAVLGEFGIGLLLLLWFLLEWLYPVFFEVLRDGATPGKRMYGLRVVHANGAPVGWTGSLVRNLLRGVDFLPLAYAAGFVTMLLDGRFRRLGDLAAGTLVIHAGGGAPAPRRDPGGEDTEPLPLPWRLSPEEQAALVGFADRAGGLTADRAEEIAAILTPLGAGDVATLRRHAAWIRGER